MNAPFLSPHLAALVVTAVGLWLAAPLNASGPQLAQSVPNDQFANATILEGTNIRVTGSNVGASREPGEPRHEGNVGGRSVWWTWTAPFAGTAEVSTRGSGFSTLLGVYVGSSVDTLVPVTADDLFDGLLFEAVGGTTYRIAVDGWSGATGNIGLSLSLFPRPANDRFSDAAVLTGASSSVTGSNAGATREAGEPHHAQGNTAHSVWWTWTAPFSGGAVVTATGDFSLVAAVYAGDSVDRLTEVASSSFNPGFIFEPVAGNTYHIVVGGRFVGDMGDFTLTLRLAPPPANDSFAGAIAIVGANTVVQGSNLAATKEIGEPNPGGFPGGHSVWWTWTAPFTGGVEISTEGSDFYNLLGVYTGASVNSLALVAEDGRIFSQSSRVVFRAVMGTTYRIAVDGWEGAIGTVKLKVALTISPANDQFADGYLITGASNTVSGSNVGASREPGEPDHTGNAIGRSVWWTWTAPFTGEVELSTSGSSFSAVVSFYLGDSVDNLTQATRFNGRFQVSGGTTYHIAVDGWKGDSGSIALSLILGWPPINDRFVDAIPIVGSSNVVAGSNQGATKEPGEPDHAGSRGGHSVWWIWTAPATGGVEVSATLGGSSALLAIYTGDTVDGLTEVASSSFWFTPAIFRAAGGTTYRIAVDDQIGFTGAVQLRVTLFPPVDNDQFADAIIISGANQTVQGSNVGATKEAGEPRHDFNAGGRSVWWRWTAPSGGGANVSTEGSSFGTVLGAYTGTSVAALTAIATSGFSDAVQFEVIPGMTYWLAVDGRNNESGNITLKVTSLPAPVNDQFTSALVLLGATNTVTGSNFGATKEASEPAHGGWMGGKSVWWNWTAPITGEVELRAEANGFDPLLGVYTGDSVDRLMDAAPSIGSSGAFRALAGTTYHIAVDSGSGRAGDYSLSLTLLAPPANDQFTNAIALQGDDATAHGSNLGASLETGEPDHGGYRGGHSVWWTWTAPATGGAEISSEGDFFFIPVLAVYTGEAPDRLTPVGTTMGYSGPVVLRAVIGTTYRIAVDGLNQESGVVTLRVRLFPPVANDQFVDAIDIPGSGPDYTVSGSNVGASKEPGEPDHAGDAGGRSVWWTWTAPATGAAEMRTAGSEFSGSVGIYTGTAVESLTEVARIERFNREAVFDVQGGTTYHVAVDGNAGRIVLGVTFFPPPANDRFADAIPITGPIRTVVGSNVGASKEVGEPDHASQAGGHSVWWVWTAPATGGVEIKAVGIDFATLVAVYAGDSLDRVRLVASASFSSPAIFRAVAGMTYRIAVDGWDGRAGEIELGLRQFPPVTNDQFADAIVLTGLSHVVRGSNEGATKEPGEPDHDFESGGRSVWWRWTAPFTGGVEVNTAGSDFGALLDVYTGDSVDRLMPVARLNFHEPVIFEAVAGTTYHVAVDGRGGQAGNIVLRLNLSAPPPNDRFADAIAVVGAVNTLRGSNTSASKEPGEPEHADDPGGHSVWWRWTAPSTREVRLSQEGTSFSPLLGIYTDNAVDRLTEVELWNRTTFRAIGGVTYQIAVDGPGGTFGEISLSLTLLDPPANDQFSHATILTGSSNVVGGSIAGAGKELGEPRHGGNAGGHSLWWSWTAPFGGALRVDPIQSGFPPLVGVYTGSSVDDLTEVTGFEDSSARVFPIVGGATYRIALDGWSGYVGEFTVLMTLFPAPNNDRFADATPLSGAIASVRATNLGAGNEPGEPKHAGVSGGHSVWWSWTAPFNGTVEVGTLSNTFTTVLGVYTGHTVEQLTELAANRGFFGPVTFRAVGGTTYQIAVDGWGGRIGEFVLNLALVPSAANDQFVDAIVLSGTSNVVSGSNVGATAEPAEPDHGGSPAAHSVWWTWTAPFPGGAEVSTAGSGFDTVLGVYTGPSMEELISVAENNNGGPTSAGRVRFRAAGGTTYRIAVDGWNQNQGDITLRVTLVPPPANDQFIEATAITGAAYTVNASNLGATREAGEPDHEGQVGGHSVWWTWTAPFSGGVEVSTAGSDFNTLLAVYTGPTVDTLTKVVDARFAGRLTFRAVAGVTYRVAVDGDVGGFGNLALGLTLFPSVVNDQFADASILSGATAVASGSNLGASKELGEPDHAGGTGGHSVWWTWTAPFSGGVILSLQGTDFEPLLGVYAGDSVDNLVTVMDSSLSDPVQFEAEGGKAYHIAVDGWNGSVGNIELTLHLVPPPTNDQFQNRINLSGASQTLDGSLLGASKEPGEPNHAGEPGGHSVWWSWTAPFTGGAELRMSQGNFSSLIGVYTGPALESLTDVARSDGSGIVSFRAAAGTTYQIAVDASYGRWGDFVLELRLFTAVENDQFADALNLSGSTMVVRGSNVGASREPGEPDHAFGTAAHSVWWNWTAPFNGGVELSTEQSDFSTRLVVYTGSAVDKLTPVTTSGSFDRIRFRAVSGTTYRIALDGWNHTAGSFQFSLRLFPPPANDQFQQATPVLGTIATVRGSNFGATKDVGEPDHAGDPGGQSVWWIWTAPCTGGVELALGQNSFQTLIGVYTGDSVEALTLVAQSRDYRSVRFRAVGGTTYRLAVDSSGEAPLDIVLHLRLLPSVENDQFADSIPIQGATTRVYGSNIGATSEPGEPHHGGFAPSRSVWWAWTAPFTGRADLSTIGSDFNAALAVYTGASVTALTEVASADMGESLAFRAQSGVTYRIAVDGAYENAGQISLRLNLGPCTDRTTVFTPQDGGPGSLRQAIADLCPGGTIEFDPRLHGQAILATDGPLVIDKNLTIAGPGAGQITVTAQSRNSVFTIVRGTVTITGLTIQDGSSQFGGGIVNQGHLSLSGCLVTANRAPAGYGGGIYNGFTGTLTILKSTLSANAAEAGGAIYNSGQAVVVDTTIGPANLASAGGGYDGGGDLAMTNSTVAGNVATLWGGGFLGRARDGVFNPIPSRMTLVSCTVASNLAGMSGGGYAQLSAADFEIWNTLIAGNAAASGADVDRFAPVASRGHNLIGTVGRTSGWTTTDLVGTDPVPVDPLLGPLQDNGGPTFTLAPSRGSAAVDRGDPNFSGPPFTDQRGPGFLRLVGNRIDIGAVETQNGSPRLACSSPLQLECASSHGTLAPLNVTVQDPDGDELIVVWNVNGVVVQTNLLPVGKTAQPSTVGFAASFALGQHTVVAAVSDRSARPVFCTNTVTVLDTTPPSLRLAGSNPLTNLNLTPFVEPGATATDACEGDLTSRISVLGPSDLSAPGDYTLVYTVTDSASHTTTATRRVVVPGPRDVLPTVLAELNVLRVTVVEKTARKKLDEAAEHLAGALGSQFWDDQTHLQPGHGEKFFNEAKKAVEKLLELLKDRRNSIPTGVLEDFMARIARATRLLASTAIGDGIHAGAEPKRIDQAREELARGDRELAEGKPDKAIDAYKRAWKTAVGAKVLGIVRSAGGSIRLDILGFPGETYAIQASADLVHWESIGERTADPTGVIRFEDSIPTGQRARFYRLMLLDR